MVIKKRFILALLWLSAFSLYGHASATASIDRNVIAIDETFQLKLTLDETSIFDKPDLGALENSFEILGSQKSSQTSYINGKKSAITEWNYQLAPKQEGILSIPPLEIDGESTQALTIKVTPRKHYSGSNTEPVFMEAITDKSSVYVQEQLLLTIRINTSLNLHNLQLSNLEINNAFVNEVSNTQYERTLNNTPYITYEIVYAIFPQTSGELTIPSLAAAGVNPGARQFNSFFGGGQNIRLKSEALTISVKEIPAHIGNNPWLPAKSVILKETWSANPDSIQVGDSITRTITTTAVGLSGEQLSPVTMQADAHYKIYPDQPAFSDSKNNEGIVGERKDAITLVATAPGQITLPAISVQWWDIADNSLKTETLPEVVINIIGSAGSTAPTPTPTPPQSNASIGTASPAVPPTPDITATSTATGSPDDLLAWQIATAMSSAIAVLFMALFFITKSRKPTTGKSLPLDNNTATKSALLALKSACSNNNVTDIRNHLLAWARQAWPHARIHSTSDLHHVFPGEDIRMWTKKIDACLYTNDKSNENWMDLYNLVAQQEASIKKGKDASLEPLYPV